jgi:hypothetical protein
MPSTTLASEDPMRSAFGILSLLVAAYHTPNRTTGSGSDCAPVQAAVALLYKTPFHVLITKTATRPGQFPTSTDEAIWAGNKLSVKVGASPWVSTQVSADNVLGSVTGGVAHYSECRRLSDGAVRGEPVAVYAAKMESGEQAQLFVSVKSGLLIRDVLDEDIMKVTADFDFANVRPPAGG